MGVGQNSSHAAAKLSESSALHEGILLSLDIVSLFTNIPLEESLTVVEECLKKDNTLCDRTSLLVTEIINLQHAVVFSMKISSTRIVN